MQRAQESDAIFLSIQSSYLHTVTLPLSRKLKELNQLCLRIVAVTCDLDNRRIYSHRRRLLAQFFDAEAAVIPHGWRRKLKELNQLCLRIVN